MIRTVLARGWLDGKLKDAPKPAPMVPDPVVQRNELLDRRHAQAARLERKIKALTTRLKKCRASIRGLERHAKARELAVALVVPTPSATSDFNLDTDQETLP